VTVTKYRIAETSYENRCIGLPNTMLECQY